MNIYAIKFYINSILISKDDSPALSKFNLFWKPIKCYPKIKAFKIKNKNKWEIITRPKKNNKN
jgi:hypothetical protein